VAQKEQMWPEALALAEDRKAGRRLEVYDAGGEQTKVLRSLIRDAIRDTAKQGRVVIVAHAASFALDGGDGILRVLVTASPETRARRFAEIDGVKTRQAASAIKESDKGRAVYLKRFYGISRELPTHYDLLLNTDFLTARHAADIIVRAATG
jgi:cytidylate kinase